MAHIYDFKDSDSEEEYSEALSQLGTLRQPGRILDRQVISTGTRNIGEIESRTSDSDSKPIRNQPDDVLIIKDGSFVSITGGFDPEVLSQENKTRNQKISPAKTGSGRNCDDKKEDSSGFLFEHVELVGNENRPEPIKRTLKSTNATPSSTRREIDLFFD